MTDQDPYTLLGLLPDAPAEAIRQAYRRQAALIHPDRQPPARKAAAAEQMRQLNAARDLLLDPARRRAYDQAHQAAAPWPEPARPVYHDMWSDAAVDRRWRRAAQRSVAVAAILIALFGVALLSVFAPGALVGLARFVWAAGRVIVIVGATVIIPLALSALLAVVVRSLRGSR